MPTMRCACEASGTSPSDSITAIVTRADGCSATAHLRRFHPALARRLVEQRLPLVDAEHDPSGERPGSRRALAADRDVDVRAAGAELADEGQQADRDGLDARHQRTTFSA